MADAYRACAGVCSAHAATAGTFTLHLTTGMLVTAIRQNR